MPSNLKETVGKPIKMRLNDSDIALLASIQMNLEDARQFIGSMTYDEFLRDKKTQYAASMAIAQAGEKVKRLSPELRQQTVPQDWKGLAGIRDWIVHEYDAIEFDTLYTSIHEDSTRVINLIRGLLQDTEVNSQHINFGDIRPYNK